MRRLVYLLLYILLIQAAHAKEASDNNDEVTFKDFTLNIGDRIDLGDYQMELIEIQSVRDGLVVMRVSKVGGSLDEQRALLLDSPNNFDGGAENGGITITVADIFDEQSAKVRIEYQQILGTPRKRASERPAAALDKPELSVQKSFDKNQMSVGDEVKVTITVKNVGTGQALGIKAEDIPPLPEFTYVAGYPPKIKETLDSGQSDSAVYVMNAVKEGSIRVPAILVSYADAKKNAKSNSSEPFNILIRPKSKADLAIKLACYAPIVLDGKGMLNISISNLGTASATRIEADGTVMPSVGLQVTGLGKSFFEILPGADVNYSAKLSGQKPGNYTIRLKVSYDGGDGSVIREGTAEVVVLEREYKYQYLLLIIPIAIITAWMYRRYREYKY
ncbi:MAG: BatD family protein [Methanothrix sp.]|nr:BatD family protein [Methanothrix sp.]